MRFPIPLALVAAAGLLGSPLVGCKPAQLPAEPAPRAPVTAVLVRHAEKVASPDDDPALTRAGEERAEDLAFLLGAAGVTHLFSTGYRRTRQTLAPLVERTGLEVGSYDPQDLDGFAGRLIALPPGSLAVVAGHSNTTPALARALGGEPRDLSEGNILDGQHDRLWVLTLRNERGPTTTLELRYGEPFE